MILLKKLNADWWKSVEKVFMERYEVGEDEDSDTASLISMMSIDNRAAEAPGPSRMYRSTFTGSLMDDILSVGNSEAIRPKKTGAFQDEVDQYKKILKEGVRPNGPTGHLDFWRKISLTLPTLSQIARKLLGIPASSVLSEITFSRATALYRNKNRYSMHDEKGEMCILMGANKDDGIRPRNLKTIAVKPINSLGEFSSEDESEIGELTPDDEQSDEELEEMIESVKKARSSAKQRQEEIEADGSDTVTSSRSKRSIATSKKSAKEAKRLRK